MSQLPDRVSRIKKRREFIKQNPEVQQRMDSVKDLIKSFPGKASRYYETMLSGKPAIVLEYTPFMSDESSAEMRGYAKQLRDLGVAKVRLTKKKTGGWRDKDQYRLYLHVYFE